MGGILSFFTALLKSVPAILKAGRAFGRWLRARAAGKRRVTKDAAVDAAVDAASQGAGPNPQNRDRQGAAK